MLTNRWNQLKFDDFESEWFQLDNGIVQGDPLSTMLYLYYNVDMLEIPHGKEEMCLGYVNDLAIVAFPRTFESTRAVNQHAQKGGGSPGLGGQAQLYINSKPQNPY